MSGAPPRLLVSVVSCSEAEAALQGGADVVDAKDPAEGSLGAPRPELLRALRALVGPPRELSAAIGDAPHLPGTLSLAATGAAACGADYVKIGLLGSSRPEQALEMLRAVARAAREAGPGARLVAVAYADADRVSALPARALPRIAKQAAAHGVMLDTAVKDGASCFAALGEQGVADFVAEARALGLMTALAGSLGPEDMGRALALGIDIVGVRGSACDGGRNGTVSAARVRGLRTVLDTSSFRSELVR